MRRSLCLPLALASLVCDCGTGDTSATADGGGGGIDATAETGATLDAAVQPDAEACAGDPSRCLSGTAQPDGFVVRPTQLKASLYRVFPASGASVVSSQIVAKDHTWAFDGLDSWGHYYVLFEPGFPADAGVTKTVTTRVGPLVVPNVAGQVAVLVKPVQLDVLQGGGTGGAMQLESALARLADPVTGQEIGAGASVSILAGTTSTPMPWTMYAAGVSAYYVQFMSPPPAQPVYQIKTSLPDAGAAQDTWNLTAASPTFAASIISPAAGAPVLRTTDLDVTFPVQAEADYYSVQLFAKQDGGFTGVYASPLYDAWDQADGSSTITTKIPGAMLSQAGTYLLNVAFTRANCPAAADGCVHASTVASEQLTVQ